MGSMDQVANNIDKIAALFPWCITEVTDKEGHLKKVIDFALLQQEFQDSLVIGNKERYTLSWPGKNECILEANRPINKTLRPCKEESINFDTTQNLVIEGDNLDVLKLLQANYLGKIKMIYIDPPYNTGNDFIYKDNYTQDKDEYLTQSGQTNEAGQLLTANKSSNGRFHSDWLSMMYPRLKLARNLLTDDGVIFISIDDNEVHNLRKICDEIFGEDNFVGDFIRKTKSATNNTKNGINAQHDYLLCFAKIKSNILLLGADKDLSKYTNQDNDPNGAWVPADPSVKSDTNNNYFAIKNPHTGKEEYPPQGRCWAFSNDILQIYIQNGTIQFKKQYKNKERSFIYKRYKNQLKTTLKTFDTLIFSANDFMNQVGTKEMIDIGLVEAFSFPKNINFIKTIALHATNKTSIILDFFAGSGTTAHAVMQLNAEDGGKRRCISVQLPEPCHKDSAAYKAGLKTIADITKERIKRAGSKILSNNQLNIEDLDTGFRVLKVDSSNMQDVYYKPDEIKQTDLLTQVDYIKQDRTEQDLLFQIMLDWGLDLSLPIQIKQVNNKQIFMVQGTEPKLILVACFDEIDNEIIDEVANIKPQYFAFAEKNIKNDNDKINFTQRLKQLSPEIEVKII